MSYPPPPFLNQFGYCSYPQGYSFQPLYVYQPPAAYSAPPSFSALPAAPAANSTMEGQKRRIMDNTDRYATTSMLCIPSRSPGLLTVATKVIWMLNLPNVCSKQDIKLALARVAEAVSMEINDYRNYCFVTFKSRVDCFNVIKSLSKRCWINGSQVDICYAKSKSMDNVSFNTLWDGKKGTMKIPWDLLPKDISQLFIDSYVDEDSLPEQFRGVMAAASATPMQYSQPQASDRDVNGGLPMEVHSPVYREFLEVHSPVYGELPMEVHSPVYGGLPLEVHSPVYGSPLRFTRPVPRIEVLEVSSPVYRDTTALSQDMRRSDNLDRSGHRRVTGPTYRDKDRSRSRSRDSRISSIGYRRAPRPIQNNHRFGRRPSPHMSIDVPRRRTFPNENGKSARPMPPAPLREVDVSIFEVKNHEVSFCSTAILDSSMALRAPRGRGSAMAFASCASTSTANDGKH